MQLVIVGLWNFAPSIRELTSNKTNARRHSHSIKFFLFLSGVSFSSLQLIIIQFNSHFPHGGTEISNCAIRKALCWRIQGTRRRGRRRSGGGCVCLWWILIVLPVDAKQLSRRVHKQTKPNGAAATAATQIVCCCRLRVQRAVVCLSLFDERAGAQNGFF